MHISGAYAGEGAKGPHPRPWPSAQTAWPDSQAPAAPWLLLLLVVSTLLIIIMTE